MKEQPRKPGESLTDYRRRLARNKKSRDKYRRDTRGERMVQFPVTDEQIIFMIETKQCTKEQIRTKAGLSEVVRRTFSNRLDR
ncbi:hypothetical protein [Mesorhizobium sp. CN2-181]|uniref:hypothetical protein n=1 Tax=Mesorhizobium yinganensis TaxID=3157707 RepID=UPI0032B83255